LANQKLIVNLTRGNVVCEEAVMADGPLLRLRGLLGRSDLAPTNGMLLRPVPAIHTAFMRFALDALFLDADLRVMRAVDDLRPWRTAAQRGAHAVLELAAGERTRRGVEVGDRLAVLDGPAELATWRSDTVSVGDQPTAMVVPESTADAMRVLLIAPDRRFRDTTSLLLSRRGCGVSVACSAAKLAELAARETPDVVVLDSGGSLTAAARSVAALESLRPSVGVVVVGDSGGQGLGHLPVLDRWGSFEELFAAIEDAHENRLQRSSLVERG
jgi:uncharacterized protein